MNGPKIHPVICSYILVTFSQSNESSSRRRGGQWKQGFYGHASAASPVLLLTNLAAPKDYHSWLEEYRQNIRIATIKHRAV